MHEFDKCNFCATRVTEEGLPCCRHPYCKNHSDYSLDVNKILNKADERNISIADVLALIREVNG